MATISETINSLEPVTIRVRISKAFKVRAWLFMRLISFAYWVWPGKVELIVEGLDDE